MVQDTNFKSNMGKNKNCERFPKRSYEGHCVVKNGLIESSNKKLNTTEGMKPIFNSTSCSSLKKSTTRPQTSENHPQKEDLLYAINLLKSPQDPSNTYYFRSSNGGSPPESSRNIPIPSKPKMSSKFAVKISSLKNIGTNTKINVASKDATKNKILEDSSKHNKYSKTTQSPPVTFRQKGNLDKTEHSSQFPEVRAQEVDKNLNVLKKYTTRETKYKKNSTVERSRDSNIRDKSEQACLSTINNTKKRAEPSKIPRLIANNSDRLRAEKFTQIVKQLEDKNDEINKCARELDVMKRIDSICQDPTQNIPTRKHFRSRLMNCSSYSYLPLQQQNSGNAKSTTIKPGFDDSDVITGFEEDIEGNSTSEFSIDNQDLKYSPQNDPGVNIGVQSSYTPGSILPNRFMLQKHSNKAFAAAESEQNYLPENVFDYKHTSVLVQTENNITKSGGKFLQKMQDGSKMDKKTKAQSESSRSSCINLKEKMSQEWWALTKITVHSDGSRNFKIIDSSPIPPGHFIIPSANNIILFGNQPDESSKTYK